MHSCTYSCCCYPSPLPHSFFCVSAAAAAAAAAAVAAAIVCFVYRHDSDINAYTPHNRAWIKDQVFKHLKRQAQP